MLIFYNNSCQPCVKHLLFFYVSNYFRYAANSYKWSFLRCLSCLSCHVMSRDKSLMDGQVYCREPRLIYTKCQLLRCIVETPDKYTCRLPPGVLLRAQTRAEMALISVASLLTAPPSVARLVPDV